MLYFYALYIVISAIVLVVLHRRSWKEFLLGFVIVSLVPGIGWLFATVWPKRTVQNDGDWFGGYMEQLDEDILVKDKDVREKVNKPKELNIIPIEEALLVNDHFTRRRIMIDVLKDDATQYIDVVKIAVENEDTETSHYAVSAIMEVKRKSAQTIRQLSEELTKRPEDLKVACAYRDALKEYMDSGFMDDNTLSVYRNQYIEVLQTIISNYDGETGNEYEEKMRCEIECANFTEAEQTGLTYLNRYPDREEPYLQLIRLYYTINSPAALQRMIQAVKDAEIVLTNHGIGVVRYWSKGITSYESELCE